jgi:hypothetical protein
MKASPRRQFTGLTSGFSLALRLPARLAITLRWGGAQLLPNGLHFDPGQIGEC